MRKINISVVGATGLVGSEFLKLLESSNINVGSLYLYASSKSIDKDIVFRNRHYKVLELDEDNLTKVDVTFLFINSSLVKKWTNKILEYSRYIIDNSSYFRSDINVPLVVPEINLNDITSNNRIIANPNCSTIQVVIILNAIRKLYKLKRVIYTTYQSVSGSGQKGIDEYDNCLKGNDNNFYPHNIIHTCIPHIDSFSDEGYTLEEYKMINETKKILHDDTLKVVSTCVRVPIKVGHAVSVVLELNEAFELNKIKKLLQEEPGVVLLNDEHHNIYPTTEFICNSNNVFVGRIRKDVSCSNGLLFYCTSNNLTRGASYNALKILEELLLNRVLLFW